MKKIIGLISVLVFLLLSKKGWSFYKKFRDSKKLDIGVESIKLPKLKTSHLFEDITANVVVFINNFSQSLFDLKQIKVDIFSTSGELVAQQTEPISGGLVVRPNQKSLLPLSFLISSHHINRLIDESGGIVNVGANFLSTNQYGIKLRLKGFVEAEGFTIPIDENVIV